MSTRERTRLTDVPSALWLTREGDWSWWLVATSMAMALWPALLLGLAMSPVGFGAETWFVAWGVATIGLGQRHAWSTIVRDGLRATAAALLLTPALVVVIQTAAWYRGWGLELAARYLTNIAWIVASSMVLAGVALVALAAAGVLDDESSD